MLKNIIKRTTVTRVRFSQLHYKIQLCSLHKEYSKETKSNPTDSMERKRKERTYTSTVRRLLTQLLAKVIPSFQIDNTKIKQGQAQTYLRSVLTVSIVIYQYPKEICNSQSCILKAKLSIIKQKKNCWESSSQLKRKKQVCRNVVIQ